MKKTELKQVLKPLIKECIKEVMFEEGVLSGIISEVVKGLGSNTIVESKQQKAEPPQPAQSQLDEGSLQRMKESKQRMLDAIGNDSYGGVDIFEGTRALKGGGDPSPGASNSPAGALSGVDPSDPGVDISGIMNLAGGSWGRMTK